MKKVLIASGIAMLAFASLASAQGYTFSTNLTVGSTGPDVVALQTWLINSGYSIPAITAGTAKGYFGSQTKSAVQKYQTAHSIPSTGFVGPLTRGALNGGVAVNPPMGCPAGYTCTPVGGGPVVNPPVMGGTPGVAGTLAFSLQSTPSNGTSVDKGATADVARYKLQAGASDMAVSSLSLDFDSRFWLYAGSITIKDDSGAVVASKTNLSQSDFTEITVGSDYRIYVPVNYVVAKAAIKYLTVSVSLLPVTDRSAATLSIIQAQVRSVDGTGVTDTQTEAADRSFSYTGSNNGQVVVTLDSSSPLKRLVQISTSAETNDIPIAVYDVKAQNKDGSLRSITLTVRTSGPVGGGGPAASTLFRDVKIKVGNQTFNADSVGSTTAFTNIQPAIMLPKDQYVPITVLVSVNKDTGNIFDGVSASTTLTVSGTNGGTTNNPVVEDSTYNTVAVNSGTFSSSDAVFSASSAVLSGLSATLGAPVVNNNTTTAYPVSFVYTLTAGDNTLYVSANPAVALSTTSTGYVANSSASTTITDVTANPGTIAGDSSGVYFVVPAGSSRTFTWAGAMKADGAAYGQSLKTFKVTSVKYDTDTTNLNDNSINYNLDALKVSPVF